MQQLQPLTLRRNFSWTFVGNVIYAASQWGMLVVLAKLGSPEMVGQFTLGLAVTAPPMMFSNLQLRSVQATDAKGEYLFSDYLGLRLIGTGLALLAIAMIVTFAHYRWETALVIGAIALAKAFESISDVFYGLIQQHERMDRIAIALIIKGPLSLLLLGFGVYLTGSVLGGAVGMAVAWAFVLFTYDISSGVLLLDTKPSVKNKTPRAREAKNFLNSEIACPISNKKLNSVPKNPLQPRWHLKTLTQLVGLSLPLGLVMMLISLNTNIPRYFIEHYWGERDLGIFSALSYLMLTGQIVVSALGQSASPRLAKYYATGNSSAFCTLLLKLVGIGGLIGGAGVLVGLVAGREILTILYRPEYAQQADLFVWLMLAAAISYVSSFLGYGMTAARYFRVQMPLFTLVTGISALVCLELIPIGGLQGAAIALTMAAMIQTSLSLGVIFYALYKLHRYNDTN